MVPSLAVHAGRVVAVWHVATGPSTADLASLTFDTSPERDVASGATGTAASGWASIGYSPALVPAPGGGLQLFFDGIHSTSTTDPLTGLISLQHNPDGSWTPPALSATGTGTGGVHSAVLLAGGPLVATNGAGGINLFLGATSAAPVQDLQPQLGGCCGYQPQLATDASGRLWIAWYSNATGHTGLYVQQLDPATAAPVGAPALAPHSESANNNTFGVALTCAASCRLVYGNSAAGSPTNLLVSWWVGEAEPTTIANLAGTTQGAGRVVAAAYRHDGRLWIAWYDGTTYRYVLGSATGAGGTVQDAGEPGPPGGAYALEALPVGDNLLLATNYAYQPTQTNAFAVFVNTVAPPAAVTPAPGPRDTDVQAAPGGKGFRIQVQYRVPSLCRPSCVAHAEIRTRSGRQLYSASAVAPLPGDGRIVIGTRGSVKLPGGKKVRFYMTVGKAALLRTPFSTQAGYRVANTRLRVWLKTRSGQVLTVRDGRIRVSIARIRSGALPGLKGIL